MDQYIHLLHNLANRAGVPPLKQVALQPGMKTVWRVTVHYDRVATSHVIVTLKRFGYENVVVETVYPGHFGNQPITRSLQLADYERLTQALQQFDFDKLSDQPNIPFYGVDVWLVERAAGGFLKSVGFSPQSASGDHARLMALLRQYLPEVTREIA
ncbi:MAG: hypothetical protein H7X77_04040 [Anaerolineae bacterium]|nr:hypothetical protein [Anaerolineae bacterium]